MLIRTVAQLKRTTRAFADRGVGFTLIEVLVALFIFSIGLLGLAALQAQGLAFSTESYQRTQATTLAYDIIDRMRTNTVGYTGNRYFVTAAPPAENCGDTTGGCGNAAAVAGYDLTKWYAALTRALGSGSQATIQAAPAITENGITYTPARITISWQEKGTTITQRWDVMIQ